MVLPDPHGELSKKLAPSAIEEADNEVTWESFAMATVYLSSGLSGSQEHSSISPF